MKRETVTSGKAPVILSALLMLLAFTAMPVHADFYVIDAGGRGVGTEIKSLPHTILSSGFYYVTKDLSFSGSHGITIDADNVTLDLMGFSLIGGGAGEYDGINMDGRSNAEIRNGTVRNFGMSLTGGLRSPVDCFNPSAACSEINSQIEILSLKYAGIIS